MKVFAVTHSTPSKLNKELKQIGFIAYCRTCGFHETIFGFRPVMEKCSNCKNNMDVAGPMWLGELHSKEYIKDAKKYAEKATLGTKTRIKKLFALTEKEIGYPPLFYDTTALGSKLKVQPPRIDDLIKTLKEQGFKASRTHFTDTGVKTNAKYKDVIRILK
ncbi:MAG: hypothetical protein GOV15_04470, partial [Candidatus Diapherotrites archaeon]|nr:hypothetical protein [Candidatus Diapherotrites archaeon]